MASLVRHALVAMQRPVFRSTSMDSPMQPSIPSSVGITSSRMYATPASIDFRCARTVEGLLARGDRRVGAVIERVWRDGGRFDGWSEHFSYERWTTAAAEELSDVTLEWFTTRERERDEVFPWDHLDSGLERDWLWDDWQDALAAREQDDCRWTPCFDCGVCPSTGTEIEVGPSGTTLLPLTPIRRG
jgi:hypothetical protein